MDTNNISKLKQQTKKVQISDEDEQEDISVDINDKVKEDDAIFDEKFDEAEVEDIDIDDLKDAD